MLEMKKSILLSFNLLVIIPLVFANEAVQCSEEKQLEWFTPRHVLTICKKDNELVYVNQTIASHREIIHDSQPLSIAPNALRSLQVSDLRIELEGNPLEFQWDSFEGLTELVELDIESAIISLKRDVFKAMPKLQALVINDSKIVEFDEGAFVGLSELSDLTVQGTNMSVITAGTFDGIGSELWRFSLAKNKISIVEPESFKNNKRRLEWLDLGYNQLTTIRRNVFNNLKSLFYLYLNNNAISTIEAGAFDGTSPSYFNLADNKLTVISDGIFNGIYTYSLDLSNNHALQIEKDAFKYFEIQRISLNCSRMQINARLRQTWGLSKFAEFHCSELDL